MMHVSLTFWGKLRGVLMTRASAAKLIALVLLAVLYQEFLRSTLLASPMAKVDALTTEERATLLGYAKDTWRSFEELTWPNGLPADSLCRNGDGWSRPLTHTSPTNIGAYLWSVVAAERLKLIDPAEAASRLDRTLKTLAGLERTHGFFCNELDPSSGTAQKFFPGESQPRHVRVSALDNAWLAAALMMVANAEPSLRERAGRLMQPMDFGFFYDPHNPADPVNHPGQLHVGYWRDDQKFYGHYGLLNTEARIVSYLGIALGQLPRDLYYRMFRTLPENWGPQWQVPLGQIRDYHGIGVFEGSYDYHGVRIVPSWGGSMFEALMVPLFIPEDNWAPRSWGLNHGLYARAQIDHGLKESGIGFWGFSPAARPQGGYQVYGVKALGSSRQGYYCHEFDLAAGPPSAAHSGRVMHGVVAPYASFLALRYAPHEALANLRALTQEFPKIYGPLGFQDSVDVSARTVSPCVLTIDQGMIMAAIANELAGDAMQHAFSDGRIEQHVRPLIAIEEFAVGAPAQSLAARPTIDLPPPRELNSR
jgi:hypothetical protein